MEIRKGIVCGANGEIVLNIEEDNTDIARLNNEIREKTNGFSEDRSRRMNVSVPVQLYNYWARMLGEECWLDRSFLKSFIREHPEYSTVNPNSI